MEWIDTAIERRNAEFVLILVFLLVLGILRQSEGQRLRLFLRSFVNKSLINQQIRQERSMNRVYLPVYFLTVGILGFFIALALPEFRMLEDWHFFRRFMLGYASILMITLVRWGIYAIASQLLNLGGLLTYHNFHWLNVNFVSALVILPMSIMITFGPELAQKPLINLGLALMACIYVIRTFRLFELTRSGLRSPWVYNVLYLCALEILPPIMIVAAISREAGG